MGFGGYSTYKKKQKGLNTKSNFKKSYRFMHFEDKMHKPVAIRKMQ